MIQVYHQEKRMNGFYAFSIFNEIKIFSTQKPAKLLKLWTRQKRFAFANR